MLQSVKSVLNQHEQDEGQVCTACLLTQTATPINKDQAGHLEPCGGSECSSSSSHVQTGRKERPYMGKQSMPSMSLIIGILIC